MATFARGHNTTALNAKNANLIHNLTGSSSTTPARITWIHDPADSLTLRGIPAIGRGVEGAIPHTRPDHQA
jgi:hypothetical protein